MKRDIKVNYGTIDSIVQELERYRSALENIESTIININNKLESENSGEAVSALRNKYSDMKGQIDSCKEEITDLRDIFSNYSNDMTSIIRPKNREAMMRVSRNDIYWNMETLISSCCNVGMTRRNAAVFKSFPSPFASDEEKAAERRNGDKLDDLHNSIGYHYNRLMEDVSDMRNLYNRKIIPYENMDDTYKTKAKSIYSKYTNFFEGMRTGLTNIGVGTVNLVKGVAASLFGLVKGVWDLGKGVVTYLGAGIGIACTAVFGDAPDCLKECKSKAAKYNETISAIIHDPFLIVEGLAQNVNDAYEEKGICYVTGYVAGEVAQLIILKKAGDKIKGVKGADTAVDAEKMALNSLDDAAKFGDKFYGDWLKSLSLEERQAITFYTGNDFYKINNYLRGTSKTLDGVDPKVLKNLNNALSKAQVPYDMTVYRGTDLVPFKGLYEVDLMSNTIDASSLIGKSVSDKAFMSTAILDSSSFNKEVLWTINVPAGSNAAYVASLSKYPTEAELLFNSGQSMIITDAIVDSSGRLHLTLDLIK